MTKRQKMLLATMAAGGENARFSPIQVQKMFFIIDREASELIDGPYFDFKAFSYGPHDRAVYEELDAMVEMGVVQAHIDHRNHDYFLSPEGYHQGLVELNRFSGKVVSFMKRLTEWVTSITFQQLVSSIFHKYPDMKGSRLSE